MEISAHSLNQRLDNLFAHNVELDFISNGFSKAGKQMPYYSFTADNKDLAWSEQMSGFLEEGAESHFFDIYNRRLIMNNLATKIAQPGAMHVDIGCSSGFLLASLKQKYPKSTLVGCDFESQALVNCQKRNPEIPLFQVDLTRVPFKGASFDSVSCLNVLEHIEDDQISLNNIHTILKKDGLMALSVPMGESLFDLYDEVHQHVRRYQKNDLIQKVEKAGFEILKANFFGAFIYPAFCIVKKQNQRKFKHLNYEQKFQKVLSQAKSTRNSRLMTMLCSIEEKIGELVHYPFGVRYFLLARKK